MSLLFKKLRYKNFLSAGNEFTEFDFCRNRTTLVVGSNGSGKSTFIDALVFVLYNKAYRKINKPQLVNSINGKNMLVEIEFETSNRHYLIRRGAKPNVFEIFEDGTLINQAAAQRDYQSQLEENILKIGYRSFTQIVVLGSAQHVPFMQLTANARREVIEDLLDIEVFSIMNTLLKEKAAVFKENVNENTMNLTLVESKITMLQKHIAELTQNKQARIIEKQDEINTLIARGKVLGAEIKALSEELSVLQDDLNKRVMETPVEKVNKLSQMIGKLTAQKASVEKDIEFYEKNESCPTCEQLLGKDFRTDRTSNLLESARVFEQKLEKARGKLSTLKQSITDIQCIQSKVIERSNLIRSKEADVLRDTNSIGRIDRHILEIQREDKQDSKGSELRALEEEWHSLQDEKKKLLDKKEVMVTAGKLLKDGGIKTVIIKQYVPIMNKLIQKYLAAMDFYVQFKLDENFNESILSRFRDDFTYASFSEGEKFRIDLALLFTWRAIAKLRNSSTCNLLILDEIFDSSLDLSGTEDFLKIMDDITADTNVFIISHRMDNMVDKFSGSIKFTKEKNFSKMGSL